jgi:hypothetical protein
MMQNQNGNGNKRIKEEVAPAEPTPVTWGRQRTYSRCKTGWSMLGVKRAIKWKNSMEDWNSRWHTAKTTLAEKSKPYLTSSQQQRHHQDEWEGAAAEGGQKRKCQQQQQHCTSVR